MSLKYSINNRQRKNDWRKTSAKTSDKTTKYCSIIKLFPLCKCNERSGY